MKIPLPHIEEGLYLEIMGEIANSTTEISEEEALQNGEAPYQLKESCSYEYTFNNPDYRLADKHKIVSTSSFDQHKGRLNPNIFVGTLSLDILNTRTNLLYNLNVEVRSVKSTYREDYRFMLGSITEKCTELILRIDSPVNQNLETDFEAESRTLYQQFAFMRSLIDAPEFEEAIRKVMLNPTTKWETENEEKDIRNTKRFDQKSIRQLVSKSNRISLPDSHNLNKIHGISSVPARIESVRKIESSDTPENRFVKNALESFLLFCEDCAAKFEKFTRAKLEAELLSAKLSNLLNHQFFKDISRPDSLKLNSAALQRKSGYREVLKAWIQFDLAAKLIWQGGENVYEAGKKDVATLYEYWLFFILLELLTEIFQIEPKSLDQLVVFQKHRISLNLRQGNTMVLKGIFASESRPLHVQFSYNKSFGGGKEYPEAGSWTTTLRPDYTLTIWPVGLEMLEAEEKEQITHIQFDAKYKVNNFTELVDLSKEEKDLDEEKSDERKGTYKNADLLKMHAYKDAIRRTGGAYVLYPGEGPSEFRGFHELVPGLGAFVVKPNEAETGKDNLKNFILRVTDHFLDPNSQREKHVSKIHEIHKDKPGESFPKAAIPEYFDEKQEIKVIPDETFVLIGFSTSKERLEWHEKHGIYNFRMNDEQGALILDHEVVNAKYLLLRKSGEDTATDIYKIKSKGPKVYSQKMLEEMQYPFSKQPKDFYLVIEIEKLDPKEFGNASWKFRELDKYQRIIQENPGRSGPGIPFAVSLTELMKVKAN